MATQIIYFAISMLLFVWLDKVCRGRVTSLSATISVIDSIGIRLSLVWDGNRLFSESNLAFVFEKGHTVNLRPYLGFLSGIFQYTF